MPEKPYKDSKPEAERADAPRWTPGPWEYDRAIDAVLDRDGRKVADLHTADVLLDAENTANGHGIAAYPDLFAALESLLAVWWAEFQEFFGGDPIADAENKTEFEAMPAVIAARAALAKARGASTTPDPGTEPGTGSKEAI